MKSILITLNIFIATLLFIGCETVIPFEGDYFTPKYVLNGIIEENKPIVIGLAKSAIEYDTDFDNCKTAIIKVFEDDIEIGTMEYIPSDSMTWEIYTEQLIGNESVYILKDYTAKKGKKYSLNIDLHDGEQIYTQSSIPETVLFDSIVYKVESYEDWDGICEGVFAYIYFTDPADKKNYYRITGQMSQPSGMMSRYVNINNTEMVYVELSNSENDIFYSNFESPALRTDDNDVVEFSGNNDRNVMDDNYFSGEQHVVKVLCIQDIDDETMMRQYAKDRYWSYGFKIFYEMKFELYSITEDLYRYYRTLDLHYNNDNAAFTEPVQVYSNIKNGVGIFSGISEKMSTTVIGEKPDTANYIYLTPEEYDNFW